MPIILHLETSTPFLSIALSDNDKLIAEFNSNEHTDHAASIADNVKQIIADSGLTMNNLSAVAVSMGPGSYTGLRIGLAFAKGICFALNIPLIALSTLEILAWKALQIVKNKNLKNDYLLVPMVDARRMEVYYAVFDKTLKTIELPNNLIIEANSFSQYTMPLFLFGSGAEKCKKSLTHPNVQYLDFPLQAKDMIATANTYFKNQKFANVIDAEPFYIKGFYTTANFNQKFNSVLNPPN